MFTGFMIGTGSFIYAIHFGYLGLKGPGVQAPGTLIVFIILKAISCINFKLRTGNWTANTNSNLLYDL